MAAVLRVSSTLSDHGISAADIKAAFDLSARFFALEDDIKARTPLNGKNAGWEKNAQIRPSTGTADQKESMQLQFARMEGLWPDEKDIPDFQRQAEYFMKKVQG
jgi:isopenicillin N synthase-like dioxygenase